MLERDTNLVTQAQRNLTDQSISTIFKVLYAARVLHRRAKLNKMAKSNHFEVKVGDKKAYESVLNKDGEIVKSEGSLSKVQLSAIQSYISSEKGMKHEDAPDVEFRINGKSLFEMKNGVIIKNALPKELKEKAQRRELFPVNEPQKRSPILIELNQETKGTSVQKLWHAAKDVEPQPINPKNSQVVDVKDTSISEEGLTSQLKQRMETMTVFEKASSILAMMPEQNKSKSFGKDGYLIKQYKDKSICVAKGDRTVLFYDALDNNGKGSVNRGDIQPQDVGKIQGFWQERVSAVKQQSQAITQQQQITRPEKQIAPGLD